MESFITHPQQDGPFPPVILYMDIWGVREELPVVKDDDIFETILSVVLGGIVARAPRPCQCPAHSSVTV